ncbi:hypothetical protein E3O19_11275 [Cryobacterium algoritolerans]|uniref:Uncharacterized protein n=1 Tax=Cryobacterium algoritolerans TaxID=1259184 RepID=A0A4V6QGZ5_9MICO|nr:hypothetical protein [Cryobacterium algoritolerans]TFC14345.1 hypothetical protein E3O19_11275 [Cryobacterium algoritolerans]
MTLEEFRRQLAEPAGRHRMGIELSGDQAAAILADDAMLHRWHEYVMTNRPAAPDPFGPRPTPLKTPLSGFAKFLIASPFLLLVAGGIGFLSTQTGHPEEKACTDAIVAEMGPSFANFEVTEYVESPGGAVDVRGRYDGGEFACGLTKTPLTLNQALVFMDGGEIRTIVL